MTINGVTLPDIPAEVLAAFPYVAIVTLETSNSSAPPGYFIYATKDQIVYAAAETLGGEYDTINALAVGYDVYMCASDGTSYSDEWERKAELSSESNMFTNPMGEFVLNENVTNYYELVWANHDILEVTGYNVDTDELIFGGVYFPNSEAEEEPRPTRCSIAVSMVDEIANEVQRLTGTTAQIKGPEIAAMLRTVTGGGGGGIFTSTANGINPDINKGNAVSSFALRFDSSAVGALV